MITYLVSGDADIEPATMNLRQSQRLVRHGLEVPAVAVEALGVGERFVVVAHGSDDGTVFWSGGVAEERERWLWVGMEPAPVRSRVYLYCCKAGPRISKYLNACECIGHRDVVPTPVDDSAEVVLRFLDEVDVLMLEDEFDPISWRRRLSGFVNAQLDREVDNSTSLRAPLLWFILSKSIGIGE